MESNVVAGTMSMAMSQVVSSSINAAFLCVMINSVECFWFGYHRLRCCAHWTLCGWSCNKKIVNDEFQRYASNNKKQYRNIVGSSFEAPFAYANVFLLFRPLETDIVFKCTVQFRVPARDRKNTRKKNKIIDTLLFRFYHFRRHDCSWWFSVFSCPLILSSPISEARASHSVLWSTGLNCIISKFI